MGNALAANHSRNFWNEVKQVNRSKHVAPTTQVIDGVSGDTLIVELWSAKFENLHNYSNPSKRLRVLDDDVNMYVSEDDLFFCFSIVEDMFPGLLVN